MGRLREKILLRMKHREKVVTALRELFFFSPFNIPSHLFNIYSMFSQP